MLNKPVNTMKDRHKIMYAACLLFFHATLMAQVGNGAPMPTFQWRCVAGDSLLNFNPATTETFHFDSLPYAEDYTLVVVYKPVVDTEATLWRLTFSDSIVRALTTERIISDSTAIRYADATDGKPVIHTLRQSAPIDVDTFVRLDIGDSNIRIAEVLYFNHRLGNAALRRVQSMLALRYGVTLGPVDYLSGNGVHIWNHKRDLGRYHHRITGIGHDTVYALRQFRSHSEVDSAVVTVTADSLHHGTFLLLGDNDAPLGFVPFDGFPDSGDCEILSRSWRTQATGTENNLFALSFDTRLLPVPVDSLVLIVDSQLYLPHQVSLEAVCFDGIRFPSDSSTFTLARGASIWQFARLHSVKGTGGNSSSDNKGIHAGATSGTYYSMQELKIFPNPTTGHYTIDVSGAQQVSVTVYNVQGSVVATFNDSGRGQYRFEGDLPAGNAYYATVTTENGSQTMKLIVK